MSFVSLYRGIQLINLAFMNLFSNCAQLSLSLTKQMQLCSIKKRHIDRMYLALFKATTEVVKGGEAYSKLQLTLN